MLQKKWWIIYLKINYYDKMQIDDEGIIIKKSKYRESSLLITFFSLNHGLNSGLVKGVLKKDFGTYEIGNKVYIKSSFSPANRA